MGVSAKAVIDPAKRADLERIFAAAIRAVDPESLIHQLMSAVSGGVEIEVPGETALRLSGTIGVYGAGKAAVAMAAAIEAIGGEELQIEGAVVAPAGSATGCLGSIEVLQGDHPVPGERSLDGARQLVARLRKSRAEQFIFPISGGASSLLAEPIEPITLRDKQEVTALLLGCGAAIAETNVVRKHISTVKGGRLLRYTAPRPAITLVLSDVVGDDPSTVGSGPSVADESSYDEAIAVLERYRLLAQVSPAVRDVLERGSRGQLAETVRASSREGMSSRAILVGSNSRALAGAALEADRMGYQVRQAAEPIVGDTVGSAGRWLDAIEAAPVASPRGTWPRGTCWLAGGETTVTVRGSGVGGRNQEFALALVRRLAGGGHAVLSAGSDGIDGPTDSAGAFVDGSTLRRAAALGLTPEPYLLANDSHSFFEPLDDLLVCGATGTNVMDIKIALL